MYLPKHFRADEVETTELLAGVRAADLVSATADGPYATFLPLLWVPGSGAESGSLDEPGASVATPGFGALHGHFARGNDHHRLTTIGESLVIVHGPEHYISPGWYPTKREHGRVVPTWNYLLAHIYGELVIHDDPAWLEVLVKALTDRHEADREQPWSVDDAPRDYVEGQLRGIVGVELRITRVEAKSKLGLHRPPVDVNGTIDGLRADGEDVLAAATERKRDAAH